MDAQTTPLLPSDPVAIVRQLDPAAITARLDAMEQERQVLLLLLRASRVGRDTRTPHKNRREEVISNV